MSDEFQTLQHETPEAYLPMMFKQFPTPLLVCSNVGVIEYRNDAWLKSELDCNNEEANILEEAFPGPIAIRIRECMESIKESGKVQSFDERFEGCFYRCTVFPLRNDSDEIMSFGIQLQDVSVEKSLAENLSVMEAETRAQQDFGSNLIHELRTPLTNILLYLSLLQLGESENMPRYIEVLKREAERAGVTIEALLQLSRFEQKKIQFKKEPLVITKFVQTLIEDRLKLAQVKGITIVYHHEAVNTHPLVTCDIGLIQQAISIILANAINYTPPNGRIEVSVLVKVAEESATSDHPLYIVGISIGDNGIGIPKEAIPKLFGRFYRAPNATEVAPLGTGLGLAIVKEIIDVHGGSIDVDSVEGEGSTFTLWIPSSGLEEHLSLVEEA